MSVVSAHVIRPITVLELPEMLAMMEESRQQKFRGSQDAKYMKAVHDVHSLHWLADASASDLEKP